MGGGGDDLLFLNHSHVAKEILLPLLPPVNVFGIFPFPLDILSRAIVS